MLWVVNFKSEVGLSCRPGTSPNIISLIIKLIQFQTSGGDGEEVGEEGGGRGIQDSK